MRHRERPTCRCAACGTEHIRGRRRRGLLRPGDLGFAGNGNHADRIDYLMNLMGAEKLGPREIVDDERTPRTR